MPWTCSCGREVALDYESCSSCGEFKTAWTVVPDHARVFRVDTSPRLEALRGLGGDPLGGGADYDLATLEGTDEALSLSAAKARAMAEAGERPAPAQVLFVRLRTPVTTSLELEVLFAAEPSADRTGLADLSGGEEHCYPKRAPEGDSERIDRTEKPHENRRGAHRDESHTKNEAHPALGLLGLS